VGISYPHLNSEEHREVGWSPEQISGQMCLECHPNRVSHETIYRFAYTKDSRDEQFCRLLPESRRQRDYQRHNHTQIFDTQNLSLMPEKSGVYI
jgi:IS30 family transposase